MNPADFQKITPLFILGIQRSGTTLLLSLLDGHPQILADVDESRFFFDYYPRARGRSAAARLELARARLFPHFNDGDVYYQKYLSSVPAGQLQATFEECLAASARRDKDVLEAYFQAIGICTNTLTPRTRYWVEKTPGNEFFLETILRWWPNARFIHMVRDPRDMYASYVARDRQNGRKLTSVDAFAFVWRKTVQILRRSQERLGGARYRVIRYGDLVTNPDETIRDLAGFLEIEDLPILHQPTKGEGRVPWGGNAVSGVKKYQIDTSEYNKWKRLLGDEEVRQIESLLRDDMNALGYSLSHPPSQLPPLFGHRARNLLREIRFRLDHH